MIQTMLSYEGDGRNYDLHDGIPPQDFTAEDLLMNDTVKRRRRYKVFLHYFADM
jgi:hypothetical protein